MQCCGSKSEGIRVLPTKTEFWYMYEDSQRDMAYYKLIRMPANGRAVRGRLYEVREQRFQETLIPLCDTMENADFLIPALTYEAGVTMSPKFKRLLPILRRVPGREGIRIHRGTHPKHSKGCILVPPYMEQALTARMLAEQHLHEEIRIEVCNHTNLTRV